MTTALTRAILRQCSTWMLLITREVAVDVCCRESFLQFSAVPHRPCGRCGSGRSRPESVDFDVVQELSGRGVNESTRFRQPLDLVLLLVATFKGEWPFAGRSAGSRFQDGDKAHMPSRGLLVMLHDRLSEHTAGTDAFETELALGSLKSGSALSTFDTLLLKLLLALAMSRLLIDGHLHIPHHERTCEKPTFGPSAVVSTPPSNALLHTSLRCRHGYTLVGISEC